MYPASVGSALAHRPTIEIEDDPEGQFLTLCHMLDGTTTVGEVIAQMRGKFPTVPEEDLLQVIGDLDKQRVLEQAESTDYDVEISSQAPLFIKRQLLLRVSHP